MKIEIVKTPDFQRNFIIIFDVDLERDKKVDFQWNFIATLWHYFQNLGKLFFFENMNINLFEIYIQCLESKKHKPHLEVWNDGDKTREFFFPKIDSSFVFIELGMSSHWSSDQYLWASA